MPQDDIIIKIYGILRRHDFLIVKIDTDYY